MRTIVVSLFAVALSAHAAERIELTVGKESAGQLRLEWQDGCARAGTDYTLYEGTLGQFDSHAALECTTGGATAATIAPDATSTYYLVVPLEGGAEGSYGVDSGGNERGFGAASCVATQDLLPCVEETFLNADAARVARLDSVLAAAGAIVEGGGSYTDVANMLAAEPDVTDVSSNGVSLYFTVDGLPTSLYDTVAARHGGPLREIIPPAGRSASRGASSGLYDAANAANALPRGQRMVGEDDDGDGRRDLPKYARVLSPWAFDFVPDDSAGVVDAMLRGIRDFQEGDVFYDANVQDLVADSMSFAYYTEGWEDLDVVFISSHGEADPNAGWGPDPYLFLGIGGTSCADARARVLGEDAQAGEIPGLHCSGWIAIGPDSNPIVGQDMIATPAFWQHVHGGALSKKLIWFDACRTTATAALAESLVGPDSIFLGWSEYVGVSASVDSATAVFTESLDDGFPLLRSFVRACENGACADTDPTAALLALWDRADLRLREALTVPAEPTLGFCGLSPTQPVELTCPSCAGNPGSGLSTQFNFTIEGVRPEEIAFLTDPLEFAKYQLRLFADVDDVESGYAQPLTELNTIPVGDGVYTDLLPITLAIDGACPYDIVEYRPWVLLPTFDEAMPGNDGRDRMYAWDALFTIEVDPVLLP